MIRIYDWCRKTTLAVSRARGVFYSRISFGGMVSLALNLTPPLSLGSRTQKLITTRARLCIESSRIPGGVRGFRWTVARIVFGAKEKKKVKKNPCKEIMEKEKCNIGR